MTQKQKDVIQGLILVFLFLLMLCIDNQPHPHVCVDSAHVECAKECGCKAENCKK